MPLPEDWFDPQWDARTKHYRKLKKHAMRSIKGSGSGTGKTANMD